MISPEEIHVNFYGVNLLWLQNLIKRYNLEKCVILYDYVTKEEIKQIQYSSQILLLITCGDEKGDGQYTGKIYEYIVAKRQILAIGARKQNVVNGLLKETKA